MCQYMLFVECIQQIPFINDFWPQSSQWEGKKKSLEIPVIFLWFKYQRAIYSCTLFRNVKSNPGHFVGSSRELLFKKSITQIWNENVFASEWYSVIKMKNYYLTSDTWARPTLPHLVNSTFKRHLNGSCFTGFFSFFHSPLSKCCTDSMQNVHTNNICFSLSKIKTHLQFRKDEQWRTQAKALVCSLSLHSLSVFTYIHKRGKVMSPILSKFI